LREVTLEGMSISASSGHPLRPAPHVEEEGLFNGQARPGAWDRLPIFLPTQHLIVVLDNVEGALERLPHSLQVPLLDSMRGRPAHVIAEDFAVSESTARRRIQEAREYIREELAPHVDDVAEVPFETVTDPVLERSQRLFEETFAPSLGPEPGHGRER